MTRIRKDHWQRKIAELDPEKDFEEITHIVGDYEFPWEIYQSLRLALFRTYAVPSIGRLLYDTGGFNDDVQKRHDDTAIILFTLGQEGIDSLDGHAAIRRMNQMHGSYDISNDDMRYVLSAFVVTPARWIDQYGWRRRTAVEELASVRFWQRIGKLMGIADIPATFREFEELLDSYEAEHFAFDEKCLAVANVTLGLFETFYPRFARKPANAVLRSLMDDHLLETFGYEKPPAPIVFLSRGGLRLRARFVGILPARKTPKKLSDYREIRSYPDGYSVDQLGTFPAGCPVPNGQSPHVQGPQANDAGAGR